jgi:hypothetical protein
MRANKLEHLANQSNHLACSGESRGGRKTGYIEFRRAVVALQAKLAGGYVTGRGLFAKITRVELVRGADTSDLRSSPHEIAERLRQSLVASIAEGAVEERRKEVLGLAQRLTLRRTQTLRLLD